MTTAFVSRSPPCTRGYETRGIFSRKLDIEDGGEHPRGARSGAPLTRGEGSGSLRNYSTKVLGSRVSFPLRRGTNED
jgi:hypothetical protein